MKEFDRNTLAEFNGQNGKEIYIAHKGKIYNVTGSKMWAGGLHMKRHHAGLDLSADIEAAPHGEEVFDRYPQIGTLSEKKEPETQIPAILASLLERYPFLERHPHPMTVHFPIVFFLSAVFFDILYLFYGTDSFASTGLYCLIGGTLFMPVAMLTGLLTWWLNYLAKPIRAVVIKIVLSCILLVLACGTLLWKIAAPGIMDTPDIARVVYIAVILSFVPIVSVIGWLGATLTFPIEKK
ncbi:MAG TPA: DUF2231 domain-containing protein [Syntrophales bacterium]|nr:DUF2231 domain-containing protein [Syntrophales bacterium]